MAGDSCRLSEGPQRDGRKYAVSANRDSKRQRVRYVETGGALVDPEQCVFCDATPFPGSAPPDDEASSDS